MNIGYQLILNSNFPAWLYPVVCGARTYWEHLFNELWNASVGEWVWRIVAGINPDASNAGFKNAIIKPEPGGGLTSALASFHSIHGLIASAWTYDPASKTYTLSVTNPANVTASIYLPSTNLSGITESGIPATGAAGVLGYHSADVTGWSNGVTVFEIGAGGYSFTVTNADWY